MPTAKPTVAPEALNPAITRGLLDWYDRSRRVLPWRTLPGDTPDPYRVWLSEVMLQQTTVAAVKSYYPRFVSLWPDVGALAAAPRETVMREWAGLGYYARARNLHDCAAMVVERFDGRFPSTEAELRGLPGIGAYTGAAIAAIAFGRPSTVVDGNVERVVSRLFAIETPLPASKPLIRDRAAGLVPVDRPGDFAQATMDLGATLCTPRSPACGICPVQRQCRAQAMSLERTLPRRTARTARPQRFGAIAVIRREDGAVLVRTRPAQGLLGGMSEFYGTDWTESAADGESLRAIAEGDLMPCGIVDHVFTHFALRLAVYAGRSVSSQAPVGCRWVEPSMIDREPLPSLMLKVLNLSQGRERTLAVVPLDLDGLGLVGLEGPDK